ncbi:uncharacterized protein LOC144868977 isoform X1 [Branchiostoma floridae x Branchiostoma japonicum]
MSSFVLFVIVVLEVRGHNIHTAFSCADLPDGTYADPEVCTTYHLCHSRINYTLRCPEGQVWDRWLHHCRLADISKCCIGDGCLESGDVVAEEVVAGLSRRVESLERENERPNQLVEQVAAENIQLRNELELLKAKVDSLDGRLVPGLDVPLPTAVFAVRVVSAGFDDSAAEGGCAEVWVGGHQQALNRRGINVVTVEETSGQTEDSQRFDTYGDPEAGVKLRDYLRAVATGRVVLIAVKDEGSKYAADAMEELRNLGTTLPTIGYRESWAMIGKKGSKTSWFVEDRRQRYHGPTVVEALIPVSA